MSIYGFWRCAVGRRLVVRVKGSSSEAGEYQSILVCSPSALEYGGNLSLAGFRDWRLPGRDELEKIYAPSVVSDGGTILADLLDGATQSHSSTI
jgi:hypothetical protein